ncbi:RteC domain-containing protein [Parabacteroides sp.]
MDVFSLTETEFFRKLTEGKNDNLHIAYKDFVLQVSELCNKETHKGCVITALLYVEVEISHLQTSAQRQEVNNTLTSFITKALNFVRHTITHYKELSAHAVTEENIIDGINLKWTEKKVALVELGYAFKVAKCFGDNISVREIVTKLARLFHVDMSDNYIYKKYSEIRVRGRNSRTYFIDTLTEM